MNAHTKLYETVASLMAPGRGIIAADESDGTAGKRLQMVHLPNEPEHRRAFRELLLTAPSIEEYISGVILYDSTIKNSASDGMPFPDVLLAKGIIPGIKVDRGTTDLHNFRGEVVTRGLDDLAERFAKYYDMGARFAKWRAVLQITEDTPTEACIRMNAFMLARYAQYAQAAGLVPIVEPEVLFTGDHDIARAEQVTAYSLQVLFHILQEYQVDLSGLILKSSMVLAGDSCTQQSTPDEVANATLRTFHVSVPHTVGGIVFLSGGQTPKRATENLQAIRACGDQPWPISFSYSRAIEEPVLETWEGKEENVKSAQKTLLHTVKMNSLAQQGKYDSAKDAKRS
jgi:fructose-bisphosphate aldolase class I